MVALLAAGCGDDADAPATSATAPAPATTAPATTEAAPLATPTAPQGESGPVTTTGDKPIPEELAKIVLAWSDAINRNDNQAAAALFAKGAIVAQSAVYRLDTAETAAIWNDGLPCAGKVIELRMVDVAVVATFELGERPGHKCDADPGTRAGAAFVIEKGLITLWQQVPVDQRLTPTEPAPEQTASTPVA